MIKYFMNRFRMLLMLIFILPGVLITGFSYAAHSDVKFQYGGEYRIPLAGEPFTLDPASYSDIYTFNVAQNLYDGLVEFDKELRVVPAIAKRWKISRDHRTYTFLLKKNVKFHNGREVTAEDFVFSFTRILNPEKKSPVASLFMGIKGAKDYNSGKAASVSGLRASDPYTFVMELEKPFAPFLSILAMINAKVIPKEAMGPNFGKKPIGTGPFRFRSWEPGKEIVLEANKDYFGSKPYLDTLRFRIYENIEWEKIFSDFESGLLDHSIVPSKKYDMISAAKYRDRYTLVSKPGLNLVYVGMNTQAKPFNDPRVRQAFNYAVDREKIVREITKRGSIPARGILPPGIPGFDPRFKGYPYDPKKARDLLAEAGYPEGRGMPPLDIWTVSKSESVQKELLAYKRYLADVGVKLVPKVAENWKSFVGLVNQKKAPLFYMAWYADYPDPDNFLYALCHSGSKTNRMGYADPEADQLLVQAREETDYMARSVLYKKIGKMLMDDAPLICQHTNSFNLFFQPWVKNIEISPLGIVYLSFREVWIDKKAK